MNATFFEHSHENPRNVSGQAINFCVEILKDFDDLIGLFFQVMITNLKKVYAEKEAQRIRDIERAKAHMAAAQQAN